MERHRTYRDCIPLAAALGAALLLPAGGAQAQIQVPNCEIRAAEGGKLNNASTSDADLNAFQDGSRLVLGKKVFFADDTSVSGALVGLGNGASVFNLNADKVKQGKKAVVRGVQGPFTPGVSCTLPAITCGGADVFVAKNQSMNLSTPGTYGKVTLENGASLTLAAGVYNVCEIRTGKHASITVSGTGQSTINVQGNVRLENDSTFGPTGDAATPLLNVGGDTVHLAAHDDVRAFITAPNARLGLGSSMTFTGAACAKTLAGSKKVDILCAPDVASTTTTTTSSTSSTSTTSSTTSTTTTTTEGPVCGNGTTDPGEQCDSGSPGGGFVGGECGFCTAECVCQGGSTTTTTVESTTTTTETTTTTVESTTTTSSTTTTTTQGAVCGNGTTEPGEQCDSGSPGGGFVGGECVFCTAECVCQGASTTTSTTETIPTTTTTETIPTTTTTETIPSTTTSTTEEATTSTTSTTTTTETTTTTTPTPTSLEFTNGAPGGPCGTAVDGSSAVVKTLTCGGLNLGGGASIVGEGPTPDGSRSRFTLDCTVSPCNIGAFTTAPATGSTDPDCSTTGCNFGTPCRSRMRPSPT